MVRLTPHERPMPIGDPRHFATIVAAAFSQRRKTLRNSLKPFLDAEDIAAAGIDPGLRAEVLSPAEFVALSSRLSAKPL